MVLMSYWASKRSFFGQSFISPHTRRILEQISGITSLSIFIYRTTPQLLVPAVAPILPATFMNFGLVRYLRKVHRRQRKMSELAAKSSVQLVSEIRTVREFGMEQRETRKLARADDIALDAAQVAPSYSSAEAR